MTSKKSLHEEDSLREKLISKEVAFSGRLLRVDCDTVKLPNGEKSTREVVRHPGAVAILAFHEEELLLVKQYRYPLEKVTLEIPAGKLDPGEEPLNCAQRELREETGFGGRLEYLGEFYTTPGFTDEIIYLYKAVDLHWDPLKADDEEFLHVVRIPWVKAVEMVFKNEIKDAKTMLGILYLWGKEKC